ncbi:hypothetical protein ACFY2K_36890 [Kitasatospora sp. NPDC001309]|uniref:hypothetical protein n=1 Tax=unclassified Kitasatospora TaxID=2633591 RepID=UPI0036B9B4B0
MELLNPACPLHGPGIDPSSLVGIRLVGVLASWHIYDGHPGDGPVEVWLIDDRNGSTNIASGTDWCLMVESSGPEDGFDMGDWGRIDVLPVGDETPFAAHLGEAVLEVRQEWEPATGRVALELDFPSGSVRCESWSGDLRLLAVDRPADPTTPPMP